MGFPWSKVGSLFKQILPFIPLVGGPAGAIIRAISSSVLVIEEVASHQPGATKRQFAIDLAGTMLTLAEDVSSLDLDEQTLSAAVGAVVDAEVSLRNAHAALVAVVDDIRGTA
jgi:hypothetical protein